MRLLWSLHQLFPAVVSAFWGSCYFVFQWHTFYWTLATTFYGFLSKKGWLYVEHFKRHVFLPDTEIFPRWSPEAAPPLPWAWTCIDCPAWPLWLAETDHVTSILASDWLLSRCPGHTGRLASLAPPAPGAPCHQRPSAINQNRPDVHQGWM